MKMTPKFYCTVILLVCLAFPFADVQAKRGGSRSDLPSDTVVLSDVAYGPEAEQKLDIYKQPGAQKLPIIVMVHGGAWLKGDKASDKVVGNKARHFLSQGYAFVSVNYRLSPKANPLEQAEDVAMALAFIQKKAKIRDMDPEKIILMGHSSGGHLVAMLSVNPAIAINKGAKNWLGSVLLDSAALNMVKRMQEPHEKFFDDVFGSDPAFWEAASPYHQLSAESKQMLLVCSSTRRTSCSESQDFSSKAKSLSAVSFSVLEIPLNHADINDKLGLESEYTRAVDSYISSLFRK